MSEQESEPRATRQSAIPYVLLPVVLLALCSLVAALALHGRARGTVKIALVAAFSGDLQGQGYDTLAAVRAAVQDHADSHDLVGGRRVEIEALDDGGTIQGATRQTRAVAVDPAVIGLVCCSTESVTIAIQRSPSFHTGMQAAYPLAAGSSADDSLVATVDEAVHPRRPVLVRTDAGPLTSSAQRRWPGLTVLVFRPAQGDRLEDVAARARAVDPDLLVLDADPATAAHVLLALRDDGGDTPAVVPAGANSAELVNWLGPRLGAVYAPGLPPAAIPTTLTAAFQQARGHAPSAADVLTYDAVATLLAPRRAPAPTWDVQRLDPGRFPGVSVSGSAS